MPTILQFAAGSGGAPSGLQRGVFYLPGGAPNGVPGGSGLRFLRFNDGVFYNQTGVLPPGGSLLRSLSLATQNSSATATFQLQVLLDPGQKLGPRSVLPGGVLTLNPGVRSVSAALPLIPIPAGVEVGLQILRILGTGGLSGDVAALAELEIQP